MRPVSPYQEPSPSPPAAGSNAPGGCLSNPTTSAISAEPAASMACAVASADPPVAHPLLTLMNGTPVRPSTDTVVSALPAASEPPAANSTSCQPTPASRSAARAATAAISRPDTPSCRRTGGCRCRRQRRSRVLHGRERIRHSAVAAGRGDQHELHRHADAQALRIGLRRAAPRRAPRRAAPRSRRRRARTRPGRRRTAGTSAGSTGSSRSTASRGGRAGAPRHRSTCRRRTSPGAGTRPRRSGGTRSRSAAAPPACRRSGRQLASTRAGSNAIAGDRATM